MTDDITLAPPDDLRFQSLVARSIRGQVPVFGVVLSLDSVSLVRAFPTHRPELTRAGAEAVAGMRDQWQAGYPIQPWLYPASGKYVVGDDYVWLALVERYRPATFAAQVLGEPLEAGLEHKVGPLAVDEVRRMLGLAPG